MEKDPKNVKKETTVPVEGSLGLLALGAVGIRAWKERRKEVGYINLNTNFIKKKPEGLKAEANKKTQVQGKEDKK